MTAPRLALSALCLSALLASVECRALERQLHLAPRLGFVWANGANPVIGPLMEVGAGYGLNDAFTLYANAGYGVGFGDAPASPQHYASVSAGVRYALDYLRVVPWIALGLRGDLFVTPVDGSVGPSVEGRLGAAWLFRRGLGLEVEAGYAFPWLLRDRVSDIVTVSVGLRFVRDL